MARALNPLEARVLGVLVEKHATVPDTYPLSLNTLVVGCNQKTTRDPVMNATDAEVLSALDGLKSMSLAFEGSSTRVTRYEHNAVRGINVPANAVALLTVLMGLAIAGVRGYSGEALSMGLAGGYNPVLDKQYALLGLGMWLGIIMMLNVWGIIWPNQKRALGIVDADADTKAKSARMAMLGSRTNLLLSIPMLTTMAMSQTIYG